jgi:hypothetical protein
MRTVTATVFWEPGEMFATTRVVYHDDESPNSRTLMTREAFDAAGLQIALNKAWLELESFLGLPRY